MNPKVSVIIPTFNREYVLQRAVESVLEQDFKDFELLIIDDGSTDKTIDLVNQIKENHLDGHKMNQNRDVVASNLGPHCPDATCRRDVLSILLILKIEAVFGD